MKKSHCQSGTLDRQRGFTLVELALVMAIVFIVGAIAVPRFSNSTVRYKLAMAAKRVVSEIEMAQQDAIATSSTRTVTFGATAKSCTTSGLADNGSTVVYSTTELDEPPYSITSLASSIAGNASTPIKFDGYGRPNGSGTIQMKIRNEKVTLILDASTGKVSIQ